MQMDLFNTEQEAPSQEEEVTQTKSCSRCNKVLPISSFSLSNSSTSNKQFYHAYCKPCNSIRMQNTYLIKKTAPPKPKNCDCCGVSFDNVVNKNIHMDHCDKELAFRGWLCMRCNVGIGFLGDNLEGVLKAVDYLRKSNERS